MNKKKLSKLRDEIQRLRRRSGIKPQDLEALAKALHRKRHPRGKEQTWVSEVFPDLWPIGIPHHGGREMNRNVVGNILDRFEIDIERYEQSMGSNDDE